MLCLINEQSLDEQHPDDHDWNKGWDADEPEGASQEQDEPRQINFNQSPDDGATSETMVVQPDEEHHIENTSAELL